MATCSYSDDEFSSALVWHIIYTDEGYVQWMFGGTREKWPYGDCFTFSSMVLRDDVLIENNKYGYVIMQNNGAMKIVNFTHVQTAETRCSFLRPWIPGMRLGCHKSFVYALLQ